MGGFCYSFCTAAISFFIFHGEQEYYSNFLSSSLCEYEYFAAKWFTFLIYYYFFSYACIGCAAIFHHLSLAHTVDDAKHTECILSPARSVMHCKGNGFFICVVWFVWCFHRSEIDWTCFDEQRKFGFRIRQTVDYMLKVPIGKTKLILSASIVSNRLAFVCMWSSQHTIYCAEHLFCVYIICIIFSHLDTYFCFNVFALFCRLVLQNLSSFTFSYIVIS